jgi:hypothetical protein
MTTRLPDVVVRNEGSVIVLRLVTDSARGWGAPGRVGRGQHHSPRTSTPSTALPAE